jgi:hypothetical protein
MFATSRICPVLLGVSFVLAASAPAGAQIPSIPPLPSLFLGPAAEPPGQGDQDASPLRAAIDAFQIPAAPDAAVRQGKEPRGVLPGLYLGLGALQTLDAHSTFRALDAGMHEGNPLMRWATSHPVAFVSMKGAATAGTIFVAEKIRKKHPKRAMAFMAAINTAYALVVLHNYRAPAPPR